MGTDITCSVFISLFFSQGPCYWADISDTPYLVHCMGTVHYIRYFSFKMKAKSENCYHLYKDQKD